MNNIELFNYSLTHPEKYTEIYYEKESLIITKTKNQENKLIKNNRAIIKNITSYEVALKAGNEQMMKWIINDLIKLLETKGINNSEFTNYWGIFDMSYSSYTILPIEEKQVFLEEIIIKYIKNRHIIYLEHGYSNTSLQVRSDSVAHKRSGGLGNKKVASILTEYDFINLGTKNEANIEDFLYSNRAFLYPDGDGKHIFKDFLKYKNIKFEWSKKHQNKFPDFCIKLGEHFFIVEHKHMKEGGGGQNKQIVEIIDLLGGKEEGNIHYVSFLDGVYFNKFTDELIDAKTMEQKEQIKMFLEQNNKNYFVNTKGFIKMLDVFFAN